MPKRRDDSLLLEDILESIANIHDYTKRMTYEEFVENKLVTDAVVRNLEIIGEAAGKLSLEAVNAMPNIPWQKIRGMRNRLIHAYFNVSKQVIWHVIEKELNPLIEAISSYKK